MQLYQTLTLVQNTHTHTFALPFDLGHRLAEVHVDASVVDQHVVHLKVRFLTVLHLKCKRVPFQDEPQRLESLHNTSRSGINSILTFCLWNLERTQHVSCNKKKKKVQHFSSLWILGRKKSGSVLPPGGLKLHLHLHKSSPVVPPCEVEPVPCRKQGSCSFW